MSDINNNSEGKQWFHVSILNYLYKTLITQYKYSGSPNYAVNVAPKKTALSEIRVIGGPFVT